MEELLEQVMEKLMEAQIHEEQALELHSPLPKSFKVCKERALERGKQSEENRGQQLKSSFALLEHFPKSILCMLYTILKLGKSTIQCFKRCTIWN